MVYPGRELWQQSTAKQQDNAKTTKMPASVVVLLPLLLLFLLLLLLLLFKGGVTPTHMTCRCRCRQRVKGRLEFGAFEGQRSDWRWQMGRFSGKAATHPLALAAYPAVSFLPCPPFPFSFSPFPRVSRVSPPVSLSNTHSRLKSNGRIKGRRRPSAWRKGKQQQKKETKKNTKRKLTKPAANHERLCVCVCKRKP